MNQTILVDENGKRTDGRSIDELREIKLTVGILKNANGSAFIEFAEPTFGPSGMQDRLNWF
jgi:exosome complex component RRP41